MICKIVLLVWYDSLYKGLTKYCQGFGAENSPLAGFFLSFKSRKELGLGDAKSPTSSALYIPGGTCSTLRDFNGASADLGRLASVKKGFLMENDAIALAEFLMRSVIVRFL